MGDSAAIHAWLDSSAVFGGLPQAAISDLCDIATMERFDAGSRIVSVDEPGDALYVVAEGALRVTLPSSKASRTAVLDRLTPGQFFGEMSLIDGRERSANVTAAIDSTLVRIGRKEFLEVAQRHPVILLNILSEMSERLRRTNSVLGNLSNLDVLGRVTRSLIEYAEDVGRETREGLLLDELPHRAQLAAAIQTGGTDVGEHHIDDVLLALESRGLIERTADGILLRYESPTIGTVQELLTYFEPSEEERIAIEAMADQFPMKITRSYAQLLRDTEPGDPLRAVVVPTPAELERFPDDEEKDVHADEAQHQPVEGIIHRYPGKLLLLPTSACFAHCRFCFRSGKKVSTLSWAKVDKAIDYIRNNPEIRDVVVTGGDPMVLSMQRLDEILTAIRAVPHVQIIRITSRVLAFEPDRMTDDMIQMLASHKPLVFISSFLHPREITPAGVEAIDKMADSGIVMLQQGPVARGINNDSDVLKELYEKLASLRVMAYCAGWGLIAPGIRHFAADAAEVRQIRDGLMNKTSGFCVPHFITLDQDDNKTRSMEIPAELG